MAPERLAAERDLISAELAKRLWVANGGLAWASAENEASLVVLEALVSRYLGAAVLRASAGLKHLQQLEETLHHADYEDVPALRAERLWAEGHFTETILAEGGNSTGAVGEAVGALEAAEATTEAEEPESAVRRLEELYQELTVLVQAELKAAEIAA